MNWSVAQSIQVSDGGMTIVSDAVNSDLSTWDGVSLRYAATKHLGLRRCSSSLHQVTTTLESLHTRFTTILDLSALGQQLQL